MEFERRAPIDTSTSITPLIDVVFLLLIFFMLTSTMTQEQSLELELPRSKSAVLSEDEALTIEVTSKDEIRFRGETLSLVELKRLLKREFAKDSKKAVLIRADEAAPLQVFVSLMDIVKAAGGESVSLATVEEQ